ncbi:MAG: Ni/Fe-hydrogenase, b-type cytochrome subunit [Nocardioidaceae bacterium]
MNGSSGSVTPASTPDAMVVHSALRGRGRIQIGQPVTLGGADAAQVLTLAAAAAPPGSQDAVDVALVDEALAISEGTEAPTVEVLHFEPAQPARRLSVTRVDGRSLAGEAPRGEVTILRGDLRAVMTAARLGRDRRLLLMKNAGYMERRGWRPLAVASAAVQADGSPGEMQVHGFVPVRTVRSRGFQANTTGRPDAWVRVPLWPASLRWLHWLNVLAIVVLSLTGFYIADPFLRSGIPGSSRLGFTMGYVRFVHDAVAWGWIVLGVVRVYLLLFSRDRYVRWPVLLPLKNRRDVRNLGRTISAYLLIHPDEAPTYIAHNPLQQLTYTGIYLMAALQVVTGLALYGLYDAHSALWRWTQLPVLWLGAPEVRLIHYLVMLFFWVFLLIHVYLSVRADTIERTGGLSSMVSGGVWLRKGSRPVDDPSL